MADAADLAAVLNCNAEPNMIWSASTSMTFFVKFTHQERPFRHNLIGVPMLPAPWCRKRVK